MENSTTDEKVFMGKLYCVGGLILGIGTYLTPETVDFLLRVGIGIGSIVSLFFAARYHWYATKEKKENIKRLKNQD